MVNYVNPLDSVTEYNKRLLPLLSGQGIHPDVAPITQQGFAQQGAQRAQTLMGGQAQADALQALQSTANSALTQHQLRLQAMQKNFQNQQAAQAAARQQQGYGGATAPVGSAGNPKGLTGQWKLLPGADSALQAMSAAFQKQFGYALPIASGGRTYAEQQNLYNLYLQGKGNLAAKPGTSEHESGRAVDFGGAAHNSGTAANNWLVQNASRYGFKWTGKNFKQFEPWHFEWWG